MRTPFPAIFALLTALALAAPARAAPAAEVERFVLADHILVPVVEDGRLRNYIFVSVRVDIADKGDILKAQERAHFLRDAFLRAAHKSPPVASVKPAKLDEAAAQKLFESVAADTFGKSQIKAVTLDSISILKR
jgi:hypothetical protein